MTYNERTQVAKTKRLLDSKSLRCQYCGKELILGISIIAEDELQCPDGSSCFSMSILRQAANASFNNPNNSAIII